MTEENQTPDGEETTVDTTETPKDDTSGDPVIAPVAKADGQEPKLSDILDEAIDSAGKGRRITSKAEETPEEEEAALTAAKKEDDEAAEKGQVRGEDGKFRAMTDEEKAAKVAEDTKKPADAVNDPIPDNTNKRTAERMRTLIDTVKEQATLIEGHTALFDAVRGTGASPDEFAAMLNYMKAVHTDDIPTLEKAYTILQSELRSLSIKIGKPVPEVNLLTDPANDDLVKEVREGKITVNRAHELAVARERLKTDRATSKTKVDAENSAAETKRLSDEGKVALDKLGDELRARDGDAVYGAKYDTLVPQLREAFTSGNVHPSKWSAVFRQAYENLKLAPRPAPAVLKEKQQPLRPKTPAGSGNASPAPKSVLEAINAALEM